MSRAFGLVFRRFADVLGRWNKVRDNNKRGRILELLEEIGAPRSWHPLTFLSLGSQTAFGLFFGVAIENTLQFTPDFDLEPLPLSGAYFPDFYKCF